MSDATGPISTLLEKVMAGEIVSIEKVDGIFGIVKLTLCSENKPCDENNFIPIQLNKIFGLRRTITMKFDTRFSFCINKTECIRAFKEAE